MDTHFNTVTHIYTWLIVDVAHFADGPIAALVYEEVASPVVE